MSTRPYWAPDVVDLTVPSVCRMYDFFLGGTHNFEVDRQAAREMLQVMPGIPAIGSANRAVMHRAVRYAASLGITQFLDIGSGIPTVNNVHEIAQSAAPYSRTVYVDNDPVAVAHSTRFLEHEQNAAIAKADIRDPDSILQHPVTRSMLDFAEPVALMLIAVVHFVPDPLGPAELIARLSETLAPGSVMVITHATAQGPRAEAQLQVKEIYRRTTPHTPLVMRSPEQVLPFFEGFDLVDPGIVPLPYWRPEGHTPVHDQPAVLHGLAGAGIKR